MPSFQLVEKFVTFRLGYDEVLVRSWTHVRMTSLADDGDLATTVDLLSPPPLPPSFWDEETGGGALTFFSFKLGNEAWRVNLEFCAGPCAPEEPWWLSI